MAVNSVDAWEPRNTHSTSVTLRSSGPLGSSVAFVALGTWQTLHSRKTLLTFVTLRPRNSRWALILVKIKKLSVHFSRTLKQRFTFFYTFIVFNYDV